jgi:transcription elongation factor S-II
MSVDEMKSSGLSREVKKILEQAKKKGSSLPEDEAKVRDAALSLVKAWAALTKKAAAKGGDGKRERDGESTPKQPEKRAKTVTPSNAAPKATAATAGSSSNSASAAALDVDGDAAEVQRRLTEALAEEKALGDKVRQSCVRLLYRALCLDTEIKEGDPASEVSAELLWYPKHPLQTALSVEAACFAKHGESVDKEYKSHVRSLVFNLKNAKNTALRSNVLSKQVNGEALASMTTHELADPELQKERQKDLAYSVRAAMAELPRDEMTVSDQFRCGKCGKRNATYYQAQTRSADEPMTTFITCLTKGCGARWKF